MRIFEKQRACGGRILSMNANLSAKTYTIKTYYDDGKLCSIYRSYPQGKEFSTTWTATDCDHFLKGNDYYRVK